MKKLLIIGASSFAGADLVRHCINVGDYEVYAQSRTFKPNCFFNYDQKKAIHIYCDLNKNTEAFFETINRIEPQYIVNFAAQSEVEISWTAPECWMQTNVVWLTKLGKFLCGQPWLEKFLQISSPESYGSSEGIMYENQPYNPSTPYALSKMAGDMSLQLLHKEFQLPVLFIRSANYCGVGQQPFKIIPKTILRMLKGDRVPLHGGGASVRGFTDIRSCSAGEVLLLEKGNIGEIYHLSHHEFPTIKEVVTIIYNQLKERGKLVGFLEDYIEMAPQRKGNDSAYKLNCDKIKSLGWKSNISLNQSISDTIDWILNNYTVLSSLPDIYTHKA